MQIIVKLIVMGLK